jgi:SAM-dependent methyltransferase
VTGKPSENTPSTSSSSPKPIVGGLPWAIALNLYELVSFGFQGWWWRLHWAVYKGFRNLDPGELVRERRGDDPGELSYGETPGIAFSRLIEWAELRPGDRVLDLGSGRGLVPMVAALRGYRAAGIEVVEEYVLGARSVARSLNLEIDFRVADMLECDWPTAELVLLNSTAFPSDFRKDLLIRLNDLEPPTRVATYDWELASDNFQQIVAGRLPVTWGSVFCRIYERVKE